MRGANYTPGNAVHYIQARKAMEDRASWEQADLVYGGRGKIAVQLAGGIEWFRCKKLLGFLTEMGLDTGVYSPPRRIAISKRWSVASGGGHLLSIAPCEPLDDSAMLGKLAKVGSAEPVKVAKPKSEPGGPANETQEPEVTYAMAGDEQVRILATREESSMVSTWTQYLCLGKGKGKRFRVFTGQYNAVAEAGDYYDDESDEYRLPDEIDGKRVIGLDDGYVLVDEMLDLGPDQEFDDCDDSKLKAWLEEYGWDVPIEGLKANLAER